MDTKKFKKLAKEYMAENQRLTGGVVLIYENKVYGWKDKLRDANHERPGVIAVDSDGYVFQAQGGNDDDGASHWVVL